MKYLLTIVIAGIIFLPPKKHIRVYLIGDSTMCNYEPSRAPLTGWGMPFAGFFDSTVKLDNRARGGRSTRTFISENRWQPIADSLQAGDYVLIQFGHNDEAKEEKYKDRYTPLPDYKANLARFIKETKAKNATPVIITPVSRLKFNTQGIAEETHMEYSAAARETAKMYDVPLIDLDSSSRALYQSMGAANARILFMQLDSLENPSYPSGQKDNTHFNEYGARRIAELVLAKIKDIRLELADRVVRPATKK